MRLTVPRMVLVLVSGLLLAYAFAVAPKTTGGSAHDAGPPATTGPDPVAARTPTAATIGPDTPLHPVWARFPPAGKTFIGIMTEKGPHDFAALDAFTAAAQHKPQVMLFGSGWAADTFDRTLFDRIEARGMLPMLGWEPWDYRVDEAARARPLSARQIDRIRSDQPDYRLSRIIAGDFDGYLRSWADGIRSLGYPVAIRFAHEMNGDWYPWCEKANGNRPGEYVKAWRHVHDLFRAAGVTNVIWVWSPNARWDRTTGNLAQFYPGDDYVDWVGATGYYGMGAFSGYGSFDQIFGPTLDEIRTFSHRPLVITETGASDTSGRKAEWITELFRQVPRHKDIIGVIWFEVDKEMDWRIVSSPTVTRAFARAVAAPRYRVVWSPTMVPRTEPDD